MTSTTNVVTTTSPSSTGMSWLSVLFTARRPKPLMLNTSSMVTVPAQHLGDAEAEHRDHRYGGVLEPVLPDDAASGEALCSRGHDVVAPQNLGERTTQLEGQFGRRHGSEGGGGEHQVPDPLQDALAGSDVADRREPAAVDREVHDQDERQPERRDRRRDRGDDRDRSVGEAAGPHGAEDTTDEGEDEHEQKRHPDDRRRDAQLVGDQRADALARLERRAEVAVDGASQPAEVARHDRVVEVQVLADGGDLLGSGVLTGQAGGRVARRQVDQHKDRERHE